MPFKLILRRLEVVFDVWSENAALFERLMKIHSNLPILYYGFNHLENQNLGNSRKKAKHSYKVSFSEEKKYNNTFYNGIH